MNDRRHSRVINVVAWLAVVFCLVYYIYLEKRKSPAENCQVYDRFGRGIGCEEGDLGDL